jgi:hypothetical protein
MSTLFVITTLLNLCVAGHTANDALVLRHRNPDGWFNLLLPTNMVNVQRFADVDGGFYTSETLKIKYDYWTFANTPNFLRGRDRHEPLLACDSKTTNNRTWRAKINGRPAILQACSIANEGDGYRYLYYITFPKLRVFDGESFRYGMFSISVAYKSDRDAAVAKRIVRSVRFTK